MLLSKKKKSQILQPWTFPWVETPPSTSENKTCYLSPFQGPNRSKQLPRYSVLIPRSSNPNKYLKLQKHYNSFQTHSHILPILPILRRKQEGWSQHLPDSFTRRESRKKLVTFSFFLSFIHSIHLFLWFTLLPPHQYLLYPLIHLLINAYIYISHASHPIQSTLGFAIQYLDIDRSLARFLYFTSKKKSFLFNSSIA